MSKPHSVRASGTIGFTHHGRQRTAHAVLVSTRMSPEYWTCYLTVTLGRAPQRSAIFNVAAGEQQNANLEAGIAAAVKSWPRPWNKLGRIRINLRVDK